MFSDELEKISWEETTKAIYSKTDADVRRALSKEHCDVNDFMAPQTGDFSPKSQITGFSSHYTTILRILPRILHFFPFPILQFLRKWV